MEGRCYQTIEQKNEIKGNENKRTQIMDLP